MIIYIVERSLDAFLVYPEYDITQAVLYESPEALIERLQEYEGDAIYRMTEEATHALRE